MILDDRPVIDQLTDPSPLNRAHEAHERVLTYTLDQELPDKEEAAALAALEHFMDALEDTL